jgi:ATP-dependent RNA helicase CshB
LPVLNNIDLNLKKTQAIIILPTKELSRQIYNKLLEFKKDQSLLKICLLMGSFDIQEQIRSLKANPSQIIVGTVSRINDLIKNKTINKDIKTLVLDEADMLIDLGFIKQVNEIFQSVNSDSLQKIACSATTHESLSNSLKKYLGNTKVISNSKSI